MIRIIDSVEDRAVAALLDRRPRRDPSLERRVARIVDAVRRGGDRALTKYARRFDRLSGSLEVTREAMTAGAATVPTAVRRAVAAAARHIRPLARRHVPRGWVTTPK